MRAFGDMVLIKAEVAEKSKGGVYLPSKAEFALVCGEVTDVGLGQTNANGHLAKADLSVGQRVLFEKNYCIRVEVNGEDVYVAKPAMIISVLDPADKVNTMNTK